MLQLIFFICNLLNFMPSNTARVTLLIDPVKKSTFEQICAAQDMTSSQVIRRLIRKYIELHATLVQEPPVDYEKQKKP